LGQAQVRDLWTLAEQDARLAQPIENKLLAVIYVLLVSNGS
jgi:hypothetical protein